MKWMAEIGHLHDLLFWRETPWLVPWSLTDRSAILCMHWLSRVRHWGPIRWRGMPLRNSRAWRSQLNSRRAWSSAHSLSVPNPTVTVRCVCVFLMSDVLAVFIIEFHNIYQNVLYSLNDHCVSVGKADLIIWSILYFNIFVNYIL